METHKSKSRRAWVSSPQPGKAWEKTGKGRAFGPLQGQLDADDAMSTMVSKQAYEKNDTHYILKETVQPC